MDCEILLHPPRANIHRIHRLDRTEAEVIRRILTWEGLYRLKKWFFNQKYRYDLASTQVFPLLTFAMMSTAWLKYFGLSGFWLFVLLPFAFIGVWCVGYIFERFKVQANNEEANLKRSYSWKILMERFDKLEGK
jgi:hypothetical protein